MMSSEINQVLASASFRKMSPTGAPLPIRRRVSGLIPAATGLRGRWVAVAGVAAARVLAILLVTALGGEAGSPHPPGTCSASRRLPSPRPAPPRRRKTDPTSES
jgi:hypothetical protein